MDQCNQDLNKHKQRTTNRYILKYHLADKSKFRNLGLLKFEEENRCNMMLPVNNHDTKLDQKLLYK